MRGDYKSPKSSQQALILAQSTLLTQSEECLELKHRARLIFIQPKNGADKKL